MKRIIAMLVMLFAILSLVACGCSDDSTSQGEDESEYIIRRPEGNTAAEKLCWLFEDLSYTQDRSASNDTGMDELMNYVSSLNQGGAIIPEEAVEELCDNIVKFYRYERGDKYSIIVELTDDGMDAFIKMNYGIVSEEGRAQLEEREWIYGNCVLFGNSVTPGIIGTYLNNDETKQLISKSEAGSQGLEYELSTDGTYYILRGIGTCTDRDLVIPGMHKGKPVRIVDWSYTEEGCITSVRFSNSVEIIDNIAAPAFTELYSVTFADGNKFINPNGFYYTEKLVEINNFHYDEDEYGIWYRLIEGAICINENEEPSRVHITEDGFAFYVDGEDVRLIGYVGDKKEIVLPSDYEGKTYKINSCAFAFRRENFEDIVLSEGVTEIGALAFKNCGDIKSLVIPRGVTKIEQGAFYGVQLESVTIPSTVEVIESNVFDTVEIMYCEAPSKPEGWYVSEYETLNWNTSRCPIVWDCKNNDAAEDGYIHIVVDGLRYGIADGVATVLHQDSKIENANIVESVAFKGNTYPVTSIGKFAFANCKRLKSVTIPSSLISIGDDAFYGCESLTEVAIPSGVTSIGKRAFYDCDSLASVTIPSSVTSISEAAFRKCESLTIYCEAESKPDGWHRLWVEGCTVEWGYTQDE